MLSIELLNPTSIFKFTRTACCLPHSCRKLFLKDESFHNSNHFHLTCLLCRFGNSYRHEQVSFLPSLTHSHIDKMFWGRCRMLGPGLGPGREGRTVDACSLRSGKHRVVNQQTVTQDLQPRELRATSGEPRQPGGQKGGSPRLGSGRRFTERSLDCFEASQPSASC